MLTDMSVHGDDETHEDNFVAINKDSDFLNLTPFEKLGRDPDPCGMPLVEAHSEA
jgi:trehalose-6-phosphatase